jgi:hypothetical protein
MLQRLRRYLIWDEVAIKVCQLGKKTILEASVDSNHVSYVIAVAHLNDDSQLRKTDIVEAIGCKQT